MQWTRRCSRSCALLWITTSLAASILVRGDLCAQSIAFHFLKDRRGVDPVSSEPRSSTMKVVIAAYPKYAFQQDSAQNFGMDLSAGRELPILWFGTAAMDQVPIAPTKWFLGLWLPVSFHMLWDLNDPTAAIVNTDYRFGGIIKAVRGFPTTGFIHEVGLRLTPFMHESTHLGDELSIAARHRFPSTFERINVSFNMGEALVSIAHHASIKAGSTSNAQIKLRGGMSWLWTDGFYSGDTTETRQGRTVHGSARSFEPILQGEYVFSRGAAAANPDTWQPFLSVDARHRVVYNYEKVRPSDLEDAEWSLNMILGLRRAGSALQPGVAETFVRIYRGVNPAGQFRNDSDFWLAGVGIGLAF